MATSAESTCAAVASAAVATAPVAIGLGHLSSLVGLVRTWISLRTGFGLGYRVLRVLLGQGAHGCGAVTRLIDALHAVQGTGDTLVHRVSTRVVGAVAGGGSGGDVV